MSYLQSHLGSVLPACAGPQECHDSPHQLRLAEMGTVLLLVRASWGCPGKATQAGDGALPAEELWQGTGSQLGLWD